MHQQVIKVGDTFVPKNDIAYFKDQKNRNSGEAQTFIKLKSGDFLIVDGHHSASLAKQVNDYQVTYED